jgi:hypothetical protein
MPDLWVGGFVGASISAALVLAGTADWEYLRARWRGRRCARRARRAAEARARANR